MNTAVAHQWRNMLQVLPGALTGIKSKIQPFVSRQ